MNGIQSVLILCDVTFFSSTVVSFQNESFSSKSKGHHSKPFSNQCLSLFSTEKNVASGQSFNSKYMYMNYLAETIQSYDNHANHIIVQTIVYLNLYFSNNTPNTIPAGFCDQPPSGGSRSLKQEAGGR